VREKLTIHPVSDVREVLRLALTDAPAATESLAGVQAGFRAA